MMMKLIKLQRSSCGKGAWAEYKFLGGRITVYLRHNVPCRDIWDGLFISCYIKPTGSNDDMEFERHEFTEYKDFVKFKNDFSSKFNLITK